MLTFHLCPKKVRGTAFRSLRPLLLDPLLSIVGICLSAYLITQQPKGLLLLRPPQFRAWRDLRLLLLVLLSAEPDTLTRSSDRKRNDTERSD